MSKKISQLNSASTPLTGTEEIPIVQSAETKRTTVNALRNGLAAVGSIGSSGLTQTSGKVLGRSTAAVGAVEEITVGAGLTLSAGVLSAAAGTSNSVNVDSYGAVGNGTTDDTTAIQNAINSGAKYIAFSQGKNIYY